MTVTAMLSHRRTCAQSLLLLFVAAALAFAGCAAQEPDPSPPVEGPVDPYGDGELFLSAPQAPPLTFGATAGQPYKPSAPAQWQFQVAATGQFAIAVSTYAKYVSLYAVLQRQSGARWVTAKTASGLGAAQLQLQPSSQGTYRLLVHGGKPGQQIYAKLACIKGICAIPACPAAPAVAAAQALAQLQKAVGALQSGGKLKGVLYTSESDQPVELIGLPSGQGAGAVKAQELLQALGQPATTAVDSSWTVAKFYKGLANSGMSQAHVQLLQAALLDQAPQWTVLRTGKTQVHVWLVGRTACGALVGLHTVVTET